MEPKHLLLVGLMIGIVFFILSIWFRRKKGFRRLFVSLGIVTGLIPLLLWVAFSLFGFIKERKFVGNYEGETGVQGTAVLDLFQDNTFILKSDSCTSGFVQGTWEYSFQTRNLEFTSTSQNMGDTRIISGDSLEFSNIPICIKLARKFTLGKTGNPVTIPVQEQSF